MLLVCDCTRTNWVGMYWFKFDKVECKFRFYYGTQIGENYAQTASNKREKIHTNVNQHALIEKGNKWYIL